MKNTQITVHGDSTKVMPIDLIAKVARCSFSDCRRVFEALELVSQVSGAEVSELIDVDPSLEHAEVTNLRYYATETAFEMLKEHVRRNPNLAELGDRLKVLRRTGNR